MATLILNGACQGGPIFVDSFEGPGLDPFWTIEATNGTITVPSAAAAHSGANSAEFNSTAGVRNIFLRHEFATPVYGTASVWAFDTGADLSSSNYLIMQLFNLGANQLSSVITFDYDLGPPDASSFYYFQTWDGGGGATAIDRTQAWHQWEITSIPTSYEIRVDGSLVYSDVSGLPFDLIRIGMVAPAFRPNWTGYFDDFQFEEFQAAAVPEPSSAILALIALGVLGFRRKGREWLRSVCRTGKA